MMEICKQINKILWNSHCTDQNSQILGVRKFLFVEKSFSKIFRIISPLQCYYNIRVFSIAEMLNVLSLDMEMFNIHVQLLYILVIYSTFNCLKSDSHLSKTLLYLRQLFYLISKFMTSQPGQQTITIHKLRNISRSKGNQILKFGQVIECNTRNNFLEKSC